MSEQTTLESLLEMGFDRNRAWVISFGFLEEIFDFRSDGEWRNKSFIRIFREKAVAYTGNQGIEQAMDWWVWAARWMKNCLDESGHVSFMQMCGIFSL